MRLRLALPLSLLALLAPLAAGCGAPAARIDEGRGAATAEPVEVVAPRKPARGLEERVNGVRVVHLSGTPEEMGTQMGEICGADLRHLVDANLKQIPWIKRDLAAAVAKARAFASGIPDEHMRELRATAKASGVEEDWLVVAATVVEVVEDLRACAAVAAWGAATPARETIVGRNLDWFDYGKLHAHGLVVVRHPDEGPAFASFGFPGLPGVLTGMNAKGLFVANLVQFKKKAPAPKPGGIPVMSLQRLILETCATADEAVRAIERASRTVPQNYIAADGTVAEFLEADSESVARRAAAGETVAGTNWAEEERGTLKGDVRFGNLCAAIDPKIGALGTAEIESALAAANSGPLSVMSVVAVPARRAVRVSIGNMPACKGPFVDLDAGALMDKDPR